jgi:transposase
MRPYGSPQQLERRRCRAMQMLRAGGSFRDVARRVQSSLSSVVRWYQAYRRSGRRGLNARPTPGRPCRLSGKQKATLKRLLKRGAQRAGYTNDLWTLRRVGKLVEAQFGVRYGISGLWRLLVVDLACSAQKPERRATQRDEEAIARWKRYTWPRIKKSPAPGCSSGVPGRKRLPAHPARTPNVGTRRGNPLAAAQLSS